MQAIDRESERLAALRRLRIFDTEPEPNFDRLTRLAARLFEVPVAFVALLDETRQNMKSCYGPLPRDLDRSQSFCQQVVSSNTLIIVPDARLDPRFSELDLVTQPEGIRFYAGLPLQTAEGLAVGTFCLVDFVPRTFSAEQASLLQELGETALHEMERRLEALRLQEEIARRAAWEEELEAKVHERTLQLASANEGLRAAEAKARDIVEQAVEGIFQTTPEGRYLSANPALARMYGYESVAELLSSLNDIRSQLYVDPESRDQFVARMDADGLVTAFEAEVYRKDGTQIWIAETARQVRDEAGALLYYEGMVKNISVRKRAERTLQENKSLLETRVQERTVALESKNIELRAEIVERRRVEEALKLTASENSRLIAAIQSSDAGVLISDPTKPDAPTIFANAAFERITGYREADVLGKNCRFLQGPETDPKMIAQIRDCLAHQRPFKGMILNYRRDGTPFWNELTINPVFDEAGGLVNFIGIQTDVSARVEAQEKMRASEEALRQSRDDAERANRAKSDFLSRMSHELRTPLNAILGFSQLLQMQPMEPGDAENVDFISKAGRHLLDLINEVLDLARIESGRVELSPEPVEIAEVLEEAICLVRPEAAKLGVRLEPAAMPGRGWHAVADRQRLKQILLNLFSNSIKYNRPGGTVTVACQKGRNARVRISVIDTGLGIPADKMGNMFVPFDRLGAELTKVEGSGIGLAISRRLARLQGGEIEVESTLGVGSTFSLRLPMAPGRAERPTVNGRSGAVEFDQVFSHKLTVLYIEDNPANTELMVKVVAKHPAWELCCAGNGRDGLRLARERLPALILLDLQLPDLDGAAVLQELRADPQLQSRPVIVVSADAMAQQSRRLLSAGASAYLTKPINVVEVLRLLDEYARALVA